MYLKKRVIIGGNKMVDEKTMHLLCADEDADPDLALDGYRSDCCGFVGVFLRNNLQYPRKVNIEIKYRVIMNAIAS